MAELPFFAYGNFTDEMTQYRIFGRKLEGEPAWLDGYSQKDSHGETYLVEDGEGRVEGRLYPTRRSDYWMLDDYLGVQFGHYKQKQVEVEQGEERVVATTYVAGAGMALRSSDGDRDE